MTVWSMGSSLDLIVEFVVSEDADESGKWKAENGKWKVESGKWKVENYD